MSFIKNIYEMLVKNSEDEFEEEAPPVIRNFSGGKGLNKEPDARIAYEYPKGRFRFPLIPDGRDKIAVKEVSQQQEIGKKTERGSKVGRKEQRQQEMPAKKVRPFTPTEIPSPVYGFTKQKKEELIEYELSGFLSDQDITRMTDFLSEVSSSIADKDLEVSLDSTEADTESFDGGETETVAQTEYVYIHSHTEELNSFEKSEKPFEADRFDMPLNSTGVEESPAHKDGQPVTGLEAIHPGLAFDPVKDGPEAEDAIKEAESPQLLVSNEMEQMEAAPATVDEAVIEAELPEEMTDKKIHAAELALEEPIDQQMEPAENKEVQSESASRDSFAADGENGEDPTARRRSHLPFNVLMLKQDKRKLENQLAQVQPKPAKPKPEPIKVEENPGKTDISTYQFPGLGLLNPPVLAEGDPAWLAGRRQMLDQTLMNFNVGAKVVNVTQGPSVTRFEVHPEPGVKVNKVTNLSDDIKLSLAARDIRIEAPIPGKHTIGIEVPNPKSRPVLISEIIGTRTFRENTSPLTAVLGLDISGNPIVTDLRKMPHGLIAGATGSGKSVCINSILVSLLYKATPDDLKLLLIDPKMVELAPYNRIPHLVSPVITDVKAATAALKWAVEEMERRYELFAHTGVRDINRFNEIAMETKHYSDKLPYIVIVIDELADLMMMSPADVEEAICRIAQKARACGIHLIIATQRPSVDVITGLIKANVPTRVAFSVSSQIDSRTIIDIGGAERLLGRGDMLFLENGSSKPVRLQGTFVSDAEIDKVVSFAREQRSPEYLFEQEELLKRSQVTEEEDELFYEACEYVIEQGGASTSSLQRRFKVGYNRAARLIDMMEDAGYISGARGSKPRDVLITEADLEALHESGTSHF